MPELACVDRLTCREIEADADPKSWDERSRKVVGHKQALENQE